MFNGESQREDLSETKVSIKLNAILAGLISVISFTTGAGSVYYTLKAEIAGKAPSKEVEELRKDLAEVKNDIKWIVRQIDRAAGTGVTKTARIEPPE